MEPEKEKKPPLTVSELTFHIKQHLEGTFSKIFLKGEVSNFTKQSSGHLYFSLKDPFAQISCVMFQRDAASLKALPKVGDQITIVGSLTVYPPKGNYQIVVRELTFSGIGELLARLEELKRDLLERGWFKKEHKKELPHLPKTIGVVTSPTGAAIQDILHILSRRSPRFHLILNPVRVQGEGSAQEIAKAIEQFNKYNLADVLIVGRGGGSIEDLWAFNEEIVAKAIFESKIPIISAVGHETDHTIADYVADKRAPTPSAAAEIVCKDESELVEKIQLLQKRIAQSIRVQISQKKEGVRLLCKQPPLHSAQALLGFWMQRLDDLKEETKDSMLQKLSHAKLVLEHKKRVLTAFRPDNQIKHLRQKMSSFDQAVQNSFQNKLLRLKRSFGDVAITLRTLDPKNLLQKGYSIILSEKERLVVKSVHQIKAQQKVTLVLSDGKAEAKIETV